MEIKNILQKNNFRFKKQLGQNFITDSSLLKAIVRDAGITESDIVLEIGAGAGTLTRALCESAKKVYTFDVDRDLQNVLKETLADCENVEVIFGDVLRKSDRDISEITGGTPFKVVANLPYYITTPLIMRFLESGLPVNSITVMVQKEVADRLTAKENTPEYGAITLSVKLRGETFITRYVDKRVFYPVPKVDSAVIRIDLGKPADTEYPTLFIRLVKAGFSMRRKTLANNLTAAFPIDKEAAKSLLSEAGFNENIRGEALSYEDYLRLTEKLARII